MTHVSPGEDSTSVTHLCHRDLLYDSCVTGKGQHFCVTHLCHRDFLYDSCVTGTGQHFCVTHLCHQDLLYDTRVTETGQHFCVTHLCYRDLLYDACVTGTGQHCCMTYFLKEHAVFRRPQPIASILQTITLWSLKFVKFKFKLTSPAVGTPVLFHDKDQPVNYLLRK